MFCVSTIDSLSSSPVWWHQVIVGGTSGMSMASLKRPMSCFPFLTQYQDIRSCFSVSVINSHPTKPLAVESPVFLRGCGPLPADLLLASCFCTSSAFPALSSPTGNPSSSRVLFPLTQRAWPSTEVILQTTSLHIWSHSLHAFLSVLPGPSYPPPAAPVCVPFSEATHSVLALALCSN